MRHTIATLTLLVLSPMLGCKAGVGNGFANSGGTSSAIIGGDTDLGDSSVIALLTIEWTDDNEVNGMSECTASVIAPTVLLTAAHCVAPQNVGNHVTFVAQTRSDIRSQLLAGQPSDASSLEIAATDYDTAFDIVHPENGHDVAVAILSQPTNLTPLPYAASNLDGLSGSVRLVGYGKTSASVANDGIKRSVVAPVDSVDDLFVHVGDSQHGGCYGDSGGPALANVDGLETIVGIASVVTNGTCTEGIAYTRVDVSLPFINSYLDAGSDDTNVPDGGP